jgi:hypothetical protein
MSEEHRDETVENCQQMVSSRMTTESHRGGDAAGRPIRRLDERAGSVGISSERTPVSAVKTTSGCSSRGPGPVCSEARETSYQVGALFVRVGRRSSESKSIEGVDGSPVSCGGCDVQLLLKQRVRELCPPIPIWAEEVDLFT